MSSNSWVSLCEKTVFLEAWVLCSNTATIMCYEMHTDVAYFRSIYYYIQICFYTIAKMPHVWYGSTIWCVPETADWPMQQSMKGNHTTINTWIFLRNTGIYHIGRDFGCPSHPGTLDTWSQATSEWIQVQYLLDKLCTSLLHWKLHCRWGWTLYCIAIQFVGAGIVFMHVCMYYTLDTIKQKLLEIFYILACGNLAKIFPTCKERYETLSSSPSFETQEKHIQ